jgi:hypothetical protein
VTARQVVELSVQEAYGILDSQNRFELPPLEAIENEDWGRDWLLSRFLELSPSELTELGLTWNNASLAPESELNIRDARQTPVDRPGQSGSD